MRVASLADTLSGKIRAWSDPTRRQSKRIKDLADIARLVEQHPELWDVLPEGLRQQVQRATGRELTPELTSVDPVRPGLTQAEACGLHPAQHQHE